MSHEELYFEKLWVAGRPVCHHLGSEDKLQTVKHELSVQVDVLTDKKKGEWKWLSANTSMHAGDRSSEHKLQLQWLICSLSVLYAAMLTSASKQASV